MWEKRMDQRRVEKKEQTSEKSWVDMTECTLVDLKAVSWETKTVEVLVPSSVGMWAEMKAAELVQKMVEMMVSSWAVSWADYSVDLKVQPSAETMD